MRAPVQRALDQSVPTYRWSRRYRRRMLHISNRQLFRETFRNITQLSLVLIFFDLKVGCRDLANLLWRSKGIHDNMINLKWQEMRWAFLTPLGWNLFDWACAGPDYLGPRVPDLRSDTGKESNGEILTCCVQGPGDVNIC